jgi:hypothetical protein
MQWRLSQFIARIPLPSPPCGGDTFPSGEGVKNTPTFVDVFFNIS